MVNPFAEGTEHPCRGGQPTLLRVQTQGINCTFTNKAKMYESLKKKKIKKERRKKKEK